MEQCDVLIVGGGPAGSSCARALRAAGLDVVVMDKAVFPRDKVCAGWITPAVIDALELDTENYRRKHVFQPITGFRVGLLEGPMHEARYDKPASYGIRRCEFDNYLLQRTGARLRLGEAVRQLARTPDGWRVNDALQTPLIVGAGGHFCPVARTLGADVGRTEVSVKAQETEFEIETSQQSSYLCKPEVPELYFCKDLRGYGWCVRKGNFINIGLGREDDHGLSQQVSAFHHFLEEQGRIPAGLRPRYQGHAYLLYPHARRELVDDNALLIGDAAGLAYGQSGEGIRPAIESGLLAAQTILQAQGHYRRDSLESYAVRLQSRLGARNATDSDWSAWIPSGARAHLAGMALNSLWFIRHVLLDRWFLHALDPPLSRSHGLDAASR